MTEDLPQSDLTNDDHLRHILQAGAPELLAVKDAMDELQIEPDLVIKALYLLRNIQRFTRYGKVSYLIQDGQVVRIEQEQGFKIR
jgi:hypothetical protein